jgi:1-deoxy-D-xylulose-5-phosphate reductoisomerase
MIDTHDQRAPAPPPVRRVAILGSTGSIGTQTLAVIAHLNTLHAQGEHPTRYEVVALATGSNARTLQEQASRHPDAKLAIADTPTDAPADAIVGHDSATRLIEATAPDLVVASIVGIAGLRSTLRAAQLGIDIALANKESLVAGGSLVIDAARRSGARILPVDSEHAGVHACALAIMGRAYTPPTPLSDGVVRVTLTASGGALRDASDDDLFNATPDQALAHPTWDMGAKVTIDCATLMNKGLELIEAHHLFGLRADQLGAVIHPQSTIHALVQTRDAGVLAHIGPTDMRAPIQQALTHPIRAFAPMAPLDLGALGSLELRPLDPERHRAVDLALRAIAQGGTQGVVLNAANEIAVGAFLDRRITLGRITPLVERVLDATDPEPLESLDHALEIDARTRELTRALLETNPAIGSPR